MTNKRKQLEEMLTETKDNIVRMQLTNMLNEELQRQNGIVKRVTDAIDSLLRDMIGLLGKRSPKNKSQVRVKARRAEKKQLAQKAARKQVASKSRKKGQEIAHEQPDDLAEVIAMWPKLPEHVKAAITDIVKVS